MMAEEAKEYVWDREIAVPARLIEYIDGGVLECGWILLVKSHELTGMLLVEHAAKIINLHQRAPRRA